jgi:dihydroorotase
VKSVRPYGEGEPVDVRLVDGRVAEVGTGLSDGDSRPYDGRSGVLLPGLVDLHTHLREPGREDAETVETGTLAAALGGFTAVHAMANTDPVADTAGVVEQVWRLGRDAGHCDVAPVGAVTIGLAGESLAELGTMADSAARVRVFSDDGHCVSDAGLMRRALEYVKAFDGVIAQHAQEPRLTVGAQMNEGVNSSLLGMTGWPAVAEEAVIARDCLLAAHVGSRLHVCHVSTAGSVELIRWAKGKGWDVTPRSPRTTWCSPTTWPAATTRSSRSTRRCAPRPTSRRCARGWPTARSTASRPTTPRTPSRTRRSSGAPRPSA